MLNIPKNGGNDCFIVMLNVLSFMASNAYLLLVFTTLESTHAPGEAVLGFSILLKL